MGSQRDSSDHPSSSQLLRSDQSCGPSDVEAGTVGSSPPLLSLTWNVLGPADDHHQLAISEVTQGGERALGRVGLQRVRHGEELLGFCHQEVGHNDTGGTCITKHKIMDHLQLLSQTHRR